MANPSENTAEAIRAQRDRKARPHLEQYAPVWVIDEQVLLEEQAIQFNVVFLHPHASATNAPTWVNRRYRYDAFNDVLYHKGQRLLDEDEALDIQQQEEPYINATISDIPNAYGG